jgi:hypothetical protein
VRGDRQQKRQDEKSDPINHESTIPCRGKTPACG